MITLNQKQLEKLTKAVAIAARLSEIERFEGYVSSSVTSTRKRTLKKQLAELTDKETEERTVNIRIEIPEGGVKKEEKEEKHKKSFSLNLKDLLAGKSNKEEDDDETLVVLKSIIPQDLTGFYGKIVKEL
jgi:hypothetical protein